MNSELISYIEPFLFYVSIIIGIVVLFISTKEFLNLRFGKSKTVQPSEIQILKENYSNLKDLMITLENKIELIEINFEKNVLDIQYHLKTFIDILKKNNVNDISNLGEKEAKGLDDLEARLDHLSRITEELMKSKGEKVKDISNFNRPLDIAGKSLLIALEKWISKSEIERTKD